MFDPLLNFGGMRVVETLAALTETTERLFPASRHRSARIRKKLIKRFGGEYRKVPAAFRHGDTLFVHPEIYAELKRQSVGALR